MSITQNLNLKEKTYKTSIFHDFQEPTIKFHDFPGLENEILKFHDFPGLPRPVRSLALRVNFTFLSVQNLRETFYAAH